MKKLKQDWLSWIIILAPFVMIITCWDRFPEQIPTHFGLDGKPDDYSGKAFGLFLLPGINIGLYLLLLVLPKIDPLKKNYALFSDKLRRIRLILHTFFTFIFFITAFYSLGYQFNLSLLLLYGMLVFFMLLGNYMGNVRHNFFIGVRTPWTLSSEAVWIRTHRLTARTWVFGSLVMMALLPFIPRPEYIVLPYILIISLVPVVYSYIIYKKTANS